MDVEIKLYLELLFSQLIRKTLVIISRIMVIDFYFQCFHFKFCVDIIIHINIIKCVNFFKVAMNFIVSRTACKVRLKNPTIRSENAINFIIA